MESKNSNELFVQQLKETLLAEKAILAGLPKLATNAIAYDQVKQVEYYARRTLERINRLEQLPELATTSRGTTLTAIGGVLAEFTELFGQAWRPEVREATAESVLQTMMHFTIAALCCAELAGRASDTEVSCHADPRLLFGGHRPRFRG
jgi:ferritin-like metal-binding protein YciE